MREPQSHPPSAPPTLRAGAKAATRLLGILRQRGATLLHRWGLGRATAGVPRVWGLGAAYSPRRGEAVSGAVTDFIRQFRLPSRPGELGIRRAALPAVAADALQSPSVRRNPRPLR